MTRDPAGVASEDKEDLLRDVFGESCVIACAPQCHGVDGVDLLPNEIGKRGFIATFSVAAEQGYIFVHAGCS